MAYKREFLVAKTTDIALSSLYYFVFALTASMTLNFLTEFYDSYTVKNNEKTLARLSFEVFFNIFFIVFMFWVIRNVVEAIPFPLEGYGGYAHAKLSLPTILILTSVTMVFFQTTLMDKVRQLNERMFAALRISDTWFGRFMQKTI